MQTSANSKRSISRNAATPLTPEEIAQVSGGLTTAPKRTYFHTNIGPGGDTDYEFDFD